MDEALLYQLWVLLDSIQNRASYSIVILELRNSLPQETHLTSSLSSFKHKANIFLLPHVFGNLSTSLSIVGGKIILYLKWIFEVSFQIRDHTCPTINSLGELQLKGGTIPINFLTTLLSWLNSIAKSKDLVALF